MKLLGLDYGEKRIGVAIGDTETKMALPLFTLAADRHFLDKFKGLIVEEEIKEIVLGLPISLKGEGKNKGETEKKVRIFVKKLREKLALPIHLEDERFSTDLATRLVGKKRKDRDAVAAAIILQTYLDRKALEAKS